MRTKCFLEYSVVLLSLILAATALSGCTHSYNNEPLVIEYYYYNTCSSCDPEREFLENFENISGISQATTDVEIKTYNVFTHEGEKAWKKTVKKLRVSAQVDFPVIKVGSEIIYISNIPTKEDLENKKVAVTAFVSPDCDACTEVGNSIISNIPDRVTINGVGIATSVRVITLITSHDIELFKKYCNAYHVKEEMKKTPIVFVGKAALSGTDEIAKLNRFLENEMSLQTVVIK